jgi:hypothetical protein
MFWKRRRQISKDAARELVKLVYGHAPPAGNYTDELLFKTIDPSVPLEGQEFCELRLFATQNPLGIRHWVGQKYGKWDGDDNRVTWDSEVADSFWIFDEAKARYAERRSALATRGIYLLGHGLASSAPNFFTRIVRMCARARVTIY